MASYYNRTASSLPLSLPGGRAVAVPAKTPIELMPEEAASPSVQAAITRGSLVPPAFASPLLPESAPSSAGFAPAVPPEPTANQTANPTANPTPRKRRS